MKTTIQVETLKGSAVEAIFSIFEAGNSTASDISFELLHENGTVLHSGTANLSSDGWLDLESASASAGTVQLLPETEYSFSATWVPEKPIGEIYEQTVVVRRK